MNISFSPHWPPREVTNGTTIPVIVVEDLIKNLMQARADCLAEAADCLRRIGPDNYYGEVEGWLAMDKAYDAAIRPMIGLIQSARAVPAEG